MFRIGFGAMQLPGPGVFGPSRDRTAAIAVLRRAVELGVDHIDTAQYYGPSVANELIRTALHPYPAGLALVSKVGARRDASGGELRVLRYLPTNLTRREIAGELSVSVHTVDSHIRRIYAKLGAADRTAAVERGRELRLLSVGRT